MSSCYYAYYMKLYISLLKRPGVYPMLCESRTAWPNLFKVLNSIRKMGYYSGILVHFSRKVFLVTCASLEPATAAIRLWPILLSI